MSRALTRPGVAKASLFQCFGLVYLHFLSSQSLNHRLDVADSGHAF